MCLLIRPIPDVQDSNSNSGNGPIKSTKITTPAVCLKSREKPKKTEGSYGTLRVLDLGRGGNISVNQPPHTFSIPQTQKETEKI